MSRSAAASGVTFRRTRSCQVRCAARSTSWCAALDAVFDAVDAEHRVAYQRAVDLAFAHTDDLSGWRVVETVRRQYVDA